MSLRALPMVNGGSPVARAEVRRHPEIVVSLAFIVTGLVGVLAGAVLLIAWGGGIVEPGGWAGPHALALTHVLALGFVTSIAIGVLYHVAPLAFGQALPRPRLALAIWVGYAGGLAVFVTGMATMTTAWIAVGAVPLGSAIAAAGMHLAVVAVRARRRYAPSLFQMTAVGALVVVAGLGITLALRLHEGAGAGFLTLLAVKIIIAVGGWLGLLVVGVSYQLVPMFTPSRVRLRFLRAVLCQLSVGVAAAVVGCMLGVAPWIRVALATPYVAGALLHTAEVFRLLAHRRDRRLTPVTAGQAVGALLFAVGAIQGAWAMHGDVRWAELAVVTALLGWTTVLIAANSVRIIPFIVWQGLPAGRRPRTFAPAPAALGWVGLGSAMACWVAATVGVLAGTAVVAPLAGVALLVCAVALADISAGALRVMRHV